MIDPTDEHFEVEFRDGPRWVPGYVARQLDLEDTFTMTYAEAMDAINKGQFADFVNGQQRRFVDAHFRDLGR